MFFKSRSQAQRVVAFVNTLFPTITKTSKKLINADKHSNSHRNEIVIVMEVVPLCRFDLVVTPRESGRAPELMVVSQLSTNVHMVNPKTLSKVEWNAPKFFGKPVRPLLTAKNLVKFIVLNITPIAASGGSAGAGTTVFSFEERRIKDRGGEH
jgi:nonsense-mediated mRNA decay protein 3